MKYKINKQLILEANHLQMQQMKEQQEAGIPQSTTSKIINVGVPVGILGGAAYGINAIGNKLVNTLDPNT